MIDGNTSNSSGVYMEDKQGIFEDKKSPRGMVKFSDWDVVGHETQIEYLKSNIRQNDLAHAYLFTGGEGIGKKRVALFFIKALLCKSKLKPCGSCVSCQQIDKRIHPDVLILEGGESIKIEESREIISRINLKPFNSPFKIGIIDDAERLTQEASNALLKTLEEPEGHTVLILITKDPSHLLKTIISRLRIVKFFKAPQNLIVKVLNKQRVEQEKKLFILTLAAGRVGEVLKLTENIDDLAEIENSFRKFFKLFKDTKNDNLEYSLSLALVYDTSPEKVLKMFDFWILALRDIINLKSLKNYKSHLIDYFKLRVSKDINKKEILKVINYINSMKEVITKPGSGFNIKLILDLIVLKIEKLKIIE